MALASAALPNSPALIAVVLNPAATATRLIAMIFFNLAPHIIGLMPSPDGNGQCSLAQD
jgi:hypothetical protein